MENENAAWDLAQAVPQIDVILYGHSHQEMPQLIVNGVLLAQARNWGQSLARADVEMERDAAGKWRVYAKRSTTIPVTAEVASDAEIAKLSEPYHLATQAYLDTPVATSEKAMDGSLARYEDHPFVDLIHQVQLEYGKADVSLATMLFAGAKVPAGKITIRQIAAIYIYDNTLYTVEMNGAQLRQALETAAGYFPAWPLPADGRIRLPGYNADSAQGVSYKVDLSKPVGQRIIDLMYKGKPLADSEKLRVALNNYRYAGGGNYTVFKGLPIVYRSPQETRELLIEYVTRMGKIPAAANGNWEIVPRAAFDALAAEMRRREQQNADTFR
jgi:2',3'-cyclic-nucleotide 2'-phosphodiesterase/3'-nucleotidase